MTTISSSTTIGITLTNPPDVNPIVVNPGVTISNIGNAVYANSSGGSWTIQNSGHIAGSGSFFNGDGVALLAGGSVTNAASASITAVIDGVHIANGAGTVLNSGTIAAYAGIVLSAGGSVTNGA